MKDSIQIFVIDKHLLINNIHEMVIKYPWFQFGVMKIFIENVNWNQTIDIKIDLKSQIFIGKVLRVNRAEHGRVDQKW